MPRIIKGGDISQGHCWFPTPAIPSIGLSVKVFSDGRPVIVVGDSYTPHIPGCTPVPTTHPVQTIIGSPNVFIGGLPIVRDGDPLSCGDVANTFQGSVYCNGGGMGPQGQQDPGQTVGFTMGTPVVEYPIMLFRYTIRPSLGGPHEFLAGCEASFNVDMYTPLYEEGSASVYRNYPGSPFSSRVGGIGLPSYATQSALIPVSILGFTVKVEDQTPNGPVIRVVSNGQLGGGLRIDMATGRIFGSMASIFGGKTVLISARNHVGASQDFRFNIQTQQTANC